MYAYNANSNNTKPNKMYAVYDLSNRLAQIPATVNPGNSQYSAKMAQDYANAQSQAKQRVGNPYSDVQQYMQRETNRMQQANRRAQGVLSGNYSSGPHTNVYSPLGAADAANLRSMAARGLQGQQQAEEAAKRQYMQWMDRKDARHARLQNEPGVKNPAKATQDISSLAARFNAARKGDRSINDFDGYVQSLINSGDLAIDSDEVKMLQDARGVSYNRRPMPMVADANSLNPVNATATASSPEDDMQRKVEAGIQRYRDQVMDAREGGYRPSMSEAQRQGLDRRRELAAEQGDLRSRVIEGRRMGFSPQQIAANNEIRRLYGLQAEQLDANREAELTQAKEANASQERIASGDQIARMYGFDRQADAERYRTGANTTPSREEIHMVMSQMRSPQDVAQETYDNAMATAMSGENPLHPEVAHARASELAIKAGQQEASRLDQLTAAYPETAEFRKSLGQAPETIERMTVMPGETNSQALKNIGPMEYSILRREFEKQFKDENGREPTNEELRQKIINSGYRLPEWGGSNLDWATAAGKEFISDVWAGPSAIPHLGSKAYRAFSAL